MKKFIFNEVIKYKDTDLTSLIESFYKPNQLNVKYEHPNDPYIVIFVTDKCNMECEYCFCKNGKGVKNKKPQYTYEQLINFLKFNNFNKGTVRFFGGEPLLQKDWIINCINKLNEQFHYNYNIFTNVTLFDFDFLNICQINNVKLFLSIDPLMDNQKNYRLNKDGKSLWNIIEKNIALLKETNLNKTCVVRTVYNIEENGDLFEYVKKIFDLGFYVVSVAIPWTKKSTQFSLNDNKVMLFKNQLDKFVDDYINCLESNNFRYIGVHPIVGYINQWIQNDIVFDIEACGAGNSLFSIATTGDIYPCHGFNGIDEFIVGNIENKKLNKVFKGLNSLSIDECNHCFYRLNCRSRCFSDSYYFNKNILKPNTYKCFIEAEIIAASAYIYKYLVKRPKILNIYKKIIEKESDKYVGRN